MAIDSLVVVFGTFVIEYHPLFGVDVPNKSLFRFPEQEQFTHSTNIISHSMQTELQRASLATTSSNISLYYYSLRVD